MAFKIFLALRSDVFLFSEHVPWTSQIGTLQDTDSKNWPFQTPVLLTNAAFTKQSAKYQDSCFGQNFDQHFDNTFGQQIAFDLHAPKATAVAARKEPKQNQTKSSRNATNQST